VSQKTILREFGLLYAQKNLDLKLNASRCYLARTMVPVSLNSNVSSDLRLNMVNSFVLSDKDS
jgi:hypothetical protein